MSLDENGRRFCDDCGAKAMTVLFNIDGTRTDRCFSCDQAHERGDSYAINTKETK